MLLAVMIGAVMLCVSGDARAEEKPLVITSGNDTATATITITWWLEGPPGEGIND